MGEQLPLYLAKNNGDPSAIAEFSSGDTIPSGNMASSISATDIFALTGTFTNLSATDITGILIDGTNITGDSRVSITSQNGVLNVTGSHSVANLSGTTNCASANIIEANITSSINVSSNVAINASSLSSMESSGGLGTTCGLLPLPAPIIWLRANDSGTAGTAEAKFGDDSSVIGVSSVPNYYQWHAAENELYVSATGVYKVNANCCFTTAATQSILLRLNVNNEVVHYVAQEVHTVADPHQVNLTYVGIVRTNQPISISRIGGSGHSLTMMEYSTVIVERVA